MDFTKALDELKRVKEFLSAVAISEETMRQVATLGDEIAALGKKKVALLSEITGLSGDYAKVKASHDAAIGRLSSERNAAQDGLNAVQKEIASSKKVFGQEAESHALAIREAKKAHAVTLVSMRDEIASEQGKLDRIKETIGKITGLSG